MRKYLVAIFFALLIGKANAQVQSTEMFGGQLWYLTRSDALDAARAQGKQVFMVWGCSFCFNTNNVRQILVKEPLLSIVNEHFILWYSDCESFDRLSPVMSNYLSHLPNVVTLPVICIIDTTDIKVAHDLRTGPQTVDALETMLRDFVSISMLSNNTGIRVRITANNNTLLIENEIEREQIALYSLMGILVDCFMKTDYTSRRELTACPKGPLIVKSSSGWSRKIVVK